MTEKDWQYITDNWGDGSETVLNEVAAIKDRDQIAINNSAVEIDTLKKENTDLRDQNIKQNQTNMALILRLSDPNAPGTQTPEKQEPKVPKLTDYAAFATYDREG